MRQPNAARNIADNNDPGPDRILGGLDYLQQCMAERRPFAVIAGGDETARRVLIQRFLTTVGQLPVARVGVPLQDEHEFLETLLRQFGFEPFESTISELQRFVAVFLKHEAAKDRRTVIVVDNAQNCGPRVLGRLQTIANLEFDGDPLVTFVLTGTEAMHRVLDSAGMVGVSELTTNRFSLDADASNDDDAAADASGLGAGELIVSLDGNLVCHYRLDREQMMIGRSEHNDVPIVSRYVSRHHALLINRPDGAYVCDLKSTNGTYVNSKAITAQALKHGDVISIGNFRLRYANPEVTTPLNLGQLAPISFAKTSVMRSREGIRPAARDEQQQARPADLELAD